MDLTQDPPTEFPYESDAFFEAVNGFTKSDAYSVTSRSTFTTTGWYHPPRGSSSGVGQNHRVTTMYHRRYYDDLLEKNYACQNDDCKHNATFSTPYEAFITHGTRCEGCGVVYYSCTTAEEYAEALERHKLRVCNRHIWESAHTIPQSRRAVDCPRQYRNCTRLKKMHIDANAQSGYSKSKCEEIRPPSIPLPPQNLVLTPGTDRITITWKASEWPGTSSITDYKYQYRKSGIGQSWTSGSAGMDFTKTITGLTANTRYLVEIWAVNSVGNSSNTSSETTTTTPPIGLRPVGTSTVRINGVEWPSAAPGDSISLNLVMPSAKGYSKINWYLAAPSDTDKGSEIGSPTTTSGTSIETNVSHSIDIPSNAQGGVYTVTAYIHPHSSSSNQSVYEYSFQIYIS